MRILQRTGGRPLQLGILPATFNPVTIAHMELARAALGEVDEVLLVLPRSLPHKEFHGASFTQRLEVLQAAAAGQPTLSVGTSEGGLFEEIAAEARLHYPHARMWFLCGRDAAERICTWDYGRAGAFREMMRNFGLLVAARQGEFAAPEGCEEAIRALKLARPLDHVSATEIRNRIAQGQHWEALVPEGTQDLIRKIYSA